MKTDGGLRALFASHIVDFHWQPLESWSTGHGVPDHEFCAPGGSTGWIEYKKTETYALKFRPGQPAWHDRRYRTGGRSFIIVRRQNDEVDELYFYRGRDVKLLVKSGLRLLALNWWPGGPRRWPWEEIQEMLAYTAP